MNGRGLCTRKMQKTGRAGIATLYTGCGIGIADDSLHCIAGS
jgi:hypothetical protein